MTIKELFMNHTGKRVHKWEHYLDIYDFHFKKYKEEPIHFLEIGVAHGGSLDLWKKYFHPQSKFYGMDILPECKKFEGGNVQIFIGSQGSAAFLDTVKNEIPDLDIILDDGGHFVKDQIVSFNKLWPKLKNGGLYICEDLHTSYWYSFGGGYKRKNTFIEFTKDLIDQIHAWHSKQPARFQITKYTREIKGIHFYNSIVVIEKGIVEKPNDIIKGENQVTEPKAAGNKNLLLLAINKIRKLLAGFR